MKKRLGIVIPWYGKELKGGAEQVAFQVATRLAARGHQVEVLTTCCRSFLDDWASNHLPRGEAVEDGVVIRRFPVNQRRAGAFTAANTFALSRPTSELLPGVSPFLCGTGDVFVHENITSKHLLSYLKRAKKKYHAFIFLPYLYGPILNGLPLVAEKAFLQPCLHDEAYAYLPQVETLFRVAKGILYNSAGEAVLARRLYGPGLISRERIVGVGVETCGDRQELPTVVGPLTVADEKYVLCLGRRDVHKNTKFLVESYRRYREEVPGTQLKVVLAGPGDETFSDEAHGVFDLGLVSEAEKAALLTHCQALFHPSENESYSRVIMEAWFHRKPVAAHRRCLATAMAVKQADGGWLAGSDDEWQRLFLTLEQSDIGVLEQFGEQGRAYARQFADWDVVMERYEDMLGLRPNIASVSGRRPKAVHQLLPGFAYGDAISNQAILLRDHLRKQGVASEIFTEALDPNMRHEARVFARKKPPIDEALIYHHSIGCGLLDYLGEHVGPKIMSYHNITPPELVKETDPQLAQVLAQGRKALPELASLFSVTVGDSLYNVRELEAHGFTSPQVLPICVDPSRWNVTTISHLMYELQDGRTNILFVGRVVRNKCQHDLIRAFSLYRNFDPTARLFLVGGYDEKEAYYQSLVEQISAEGLEGDVFFAGKVDDEHLHSYFRTAHLYWSMSEHEGFGVPFIEAMWFDVPVLAYKSSAIPETLGEGGILFTGKDDLEQVAALAHCLVHNEDLRTRILDAQQRRRQDFLPAAVLPLFDAILEPLV